MSQYNELRRQGLTDTEIYNKQGFTGLEVPNFVPDIEDLKKQGLQAFVVPVEPEMVLFGYGKSIDQIFDTGKILRVRTLVFWSVETQSASATATTGPLKGCKVSKPCPGGRFRILGVFPCTELSEKNWESGKWDTDE